MRTSIPFRRILTSLLQTSGPTPQVFCLHLWFQQVSHKIIWHWNITQLVSVMLVIFSCFECFNYISALEPVKCWCLTWNIPVSFRSPVSQLSPSHTSCLNTTLSGQSSFITWAELALNHVPVFSSQSLLYVLFVLIADVLMKYNAIICLKLSRRVRQAEGSQCEIHRFQRLETMGAGGESRVPKIGLWGNPSTG